MEYIDNWAWDIILNPYVWAIACTSVTFDTLAFLIIFWRSHGKAKEKRED